MRSIREQLICGLLALSFPAQPVLAMSMLPDARRESTHVTPAASGEQAHSSTFRMGFAPMMMVPVASISPLLLEQQRSSIAGQLKSLGFETEAAATMAGELNADDLQVLLANPKMMQRAGELDSGLEALFWVVLIVGGIALLVILSEGSSVAVNT